MVGGRDVRNFRRKTPSRPEERGLGVPNTLMQLPDDRRNFAGEKVECDKAVFSAGVSLALVHLSGRLCCSHHLKKRAERPLGPGAPG